MAFVTTKIIIAAAVVGAIAASCCVNDIKQALSVFVTGQSSKNIQLKLDSTIVSLKSRCINT